MVHDKIIRHLTG